MRIAGFVLAMLLVSPLAAAQEDRDVAAEAFRAGEAAYARRDYTTAARSFEAAYRLAPHPVASYNAGLAWQAAKDKPRAADAFAVALASEGLDPTQRADAEKQLTSLQKALGRIVVTAPAGSTVTLAHAQKRPTPTEIHLPPGRYELAVDRSDGEHLTRSVILEAGAAVDVTIEAPPPPPEPPPAPPIEQESNPPSAHVVAGFVVLGLGVVAGAAAIGTGVTALDARDEFDASAHIDADAHDRAATLRVATNVLWAAAGTCALAGAIVVGTAPDWSEGGTAIEVGPTGVRLRTRF